MSTEPAYKGPFLAGRKLTEKDIKIFGVTPQQLQNAINLSDTMKSDIRAKIEKGTIHNSRAKKDVSTEEELKLNDAGTVPEGIITQSLGRNFVPTAFNDRHIKPDIDWLDLAIKAIQTRHTQYGGPMHLMVPPYQIIPSLTPPAPNAPRGVKPHYKWRFGVVEYQWNDINLPMTCNFLGFAFGWELLEYARYGEFGDPTRPPIYGIPWIYLHPWSEIVVPTISNTNDIVLDLVITDKPQEEVYEYST